ncbi:MAG: undecaprenyldiphospho-muramoylpentapeptide beta-N-acetylglucosaminyltransferase [Candidatus Methylomirabilales bacterium]
MKVVLAGGGTGGHVFPALALARELRGRDMEAMLIGAARGPEGAAFAAEGFPMETIRVGGLKGLRPKAQASSVVLLPQALVHALMLLRRHQPSAVVGVGGYAAGPVAMGAVLRRIPLLIHEQNVAPGLTNRVLGRVADVVAVSFEETGPAFGREVVVTGNPIRREILEADRRKGVEAFHLDPNKLTVLVFGGSQGAHRINQAVAEALPHLGRLRDRLQVIHATGERDRNEMEEAYRVWKGAARVLPFIQDMASAYAAADLVVSRAGATTIAELTALGKPALLIPYPFAANDHQRENAEEVVRVGGARLVLDRDLTGHRLALEMHELLDDPAALAEMGRAARGLGRPDAATHLADLVCRLAGAGRGPHVARRPAEKGQSREMER